MPRQGVQLSSGCRHIFDVPPTPLRPPGAVREVKLQPDAITRDSQVFGFAVSYVSATELNE